LTTKSGFATFGKLTNFLKEVNMRKFTVQDLDTRPNRKARCLLESVSNGIKILLRESDDLDESSKRIMLEQFYKDLQELNEKRKEAGTW
jgi:hypothetical protein|tara:strand:- start:24 stop:290 length:267 start_codon:yes stop_codon:yes gene_type:complete